MTKTRPSTLALAGALLLALPGVLRAEPPPVTVPVPPAKLLDATAPSIVTVKFVLKTRMSFGGQTQDDESNSEVRGVAVDPSGIVMLANGSLEGGGGMLRRFRRQGMEMTSSPSDFKVIVGTDPKEHEAVLLARDSTLGLAFVQMLSVEGAALAPARLPATPYAVEIGQPLYGVSRLSRGFDYAPTIGLLFVTGKVEKPRSMWSVAGTFAQAGLPVYDAQGQAAGVLAMQEAAEGSSGGGSSLMSMLTSEGGTFLLPLDAVGRALDAARKRAPEALAKAREAAKPAEEPSPGTPPAGSLPEGPKPPEEKPPESPPAPPKPNAASE
jgi:hypothetical protein